MRVGIDYHPAVTHAPGIGRYARELVRALVQLPDAPSLALLDVGGGPRTMGEAALGLAGARARVRRVRLPLPRRLATAAMLGGGVERLLGDIDVFHRIHSGWPPVRRAVTVWTVAELPAPEGPAEERLRADLRGIDHFVVASEHAARSLRERFDVPSTRIHHVPVGCDHWLRDLRVRFPEPPPRALPPEILVLGAVRPERRPEAVLAAFELLHAREPQTCLRFVGRGGPASRSFEERLADSPAAAGVRWIRDPQEADMPELVARASVLVHLSAGEETAVTPLEAFSMGTPVVASRLDAFVEALGAEAQLLTAEESAAPDSLAAAIERAIASSLDSGAADRRRALAAELTWERNARETARIYETIAAQRGCERADAPAC